MKHRHRYNRWNKCIRATDTGYCEHKRERCSKCNRYEGFAGFDKHGHCDRCRGEYRR